MKRYIIILLTAFSLISCVKEKNYPQPNSGKGNGLVIEFNHKPYDAVSITTRSTLSKDAEDRVFNLFVIIFRNDGRTIYSQLYNEDTRIDDQILPEHLKYCWYASAVDNDIDTWGRIKINSADIPYNLNGRIYVISNIDNEITTLTESQLDAINTESEMLQLVSSFLSPSTARTGNFVMVGSGDIKIENGEITALACDKVPSADPVSTLNLERIDAKIEVNFAVVPGAKVEIHEIMPDGTPQSFYQEIESFELESWQVVNLPRSSFVVGQPEENVPVNEDLGGYFDSHVYSVETMTSVPCLGYRTADLTNSNPVDTTRTVYGFSFYMYENHQAAKKSVTASTYSDVSPYHLRDKRLKNADGSFAANSGDMWEFADENATYIIAKGVAKLKHIFISGHPDLSHSLLADVTYCIHLGDFGSSTDGSDITRFDNYRIERNTHYTYNVNISGVNSIVVEATKDQNGYNRNNEVQSGAEGFVFANPTSNNYTFDAHFGQRVFAIKYEDFEIFADIDSLSWFVNSPFGRNGMPDRVGSERVEVPNALDYSWLHFAINTGDNPQNNRPWPGKNSPQLMDVMGFAKYMRTEVKKKRNGLPSDFDINEGGVIYVSVYVDEYYYDVDPITGEERESLWHEFVNKPNREISLICKSALSADNASAFTKGLITIRQRSIQTIYNIEEAAEGWGVEVVDEYDSKLKFHRSDDVQSNEQNISISNLGTTSNDNGLYNSGLLWGLVNGSGTNGGSFVQNVPWSRFMNYDMPDVGLEETDFLVSSPDFHTLRYACLARNRDENGNGVIDKDEIKWYMASIDQLRLMFVADQGLVGQAQLYYVPDAGMSGTEKGYYPGENYWYLKWRSHVVSSTLNSGKPQIVWAEEGCSVGPYAKAVQWNKAGRNTERCVRNLERSKSESDIKDITNPNSKPEDLITTIHNADGTYTFDLAKVNTASLRPKVSGELIPGDQFSSMARPYSKFQTGPLCNLDALTSYDDAGYFKLQKLLLSGRSVCPSGYRVPNIREMAVAFICVPSKSDPLWVLDKGLMCCNYYSFGNKEVGGKDYDRGTGSDNAYTFYFIRSNSETQDMISTSHGKQKNPTQGLIRCVRDVD